MHKKNKNEKVKCPLDRSREEKNRNEKIE